MVGASGKDIGLYSGGTGLILARITGYHNEFRLLLATCFHAGVLLGLIFDPENGGNMFL
jgi:hypothetical protein